MAAQTAVEAKETADRMAKAAEEAAETARVAAQTAVEAKETADRTEQAAPKVAETAEIASRTAADSEAQGAGPRTGGSKGSLSKYTSSLERGPQARCDSRSEANHSAWRELLRTVNRTNTPSPVLWKRGTPPVGSGADSLDQELGVQEPSFGVRQSQQ